MRFFWSCLLVTMGLVGLTCAAEVTGAEGVWTVGSGDARVEILRESDRVLNGRIVWLRMPLYDDKDAEAGQPKHDRNNPDVARQGDPLIGLALLRNFRYDEDNVWKGGTIYDPKNGKTYKCKLKLVDNEHLDVRGFIGISLLGRTETWTRFSETK